MLEVMKFIFSSFWVWLGTFLLIAAFGGAISRVIFVARDVVK